MSINFKNPSIKGINRAFTFQSIVRVMGSYFLVPISNQKLRVFAASLLN